MKKYPKHKDSGNQWIGKVPEHWHLYSLKYYLSLQKGRKPKDFVDEGDLPYVTMDYIRSRDNKTCLYPSSTEGLVPISNDDILVLWDGANAGEIIKAKKGFLSSTMAVLDFDKKIGLRQYLFYLLKQMEPIFKTFANGTTIPHFDSSVLLDYKYPLPPLSEQQAIVEFLDKKTGQIDQSIALLETQKTDLQSYRQALITETVTKGLNPNTPMKDSGIQWLKEIPINWGICRIKDVVETKSGINLTTESVSKNGLYPVYGGNGIRGYYSSFSNEGDHILIGRQGALCGNINYASGQFWATEHAVVCYPKKPFVLKWLGELLRIMNLGQYSLSAAQPGLSMERIKMLSIPLPPFSEQRAIADYLDKKTNEIDAALKQIDTQIADLHAYRTALISEAVTGKIDVRL